MELHHQVRSANESHKGKVEVGEEGSSPELGETGEPEELWVVRQVSQVVGEPFGSQDGFCLAQADDGQE